MTKQEYLAIGELDFTVSKQKMFYENEESLTFEDTPFFATVNDKLEPGSYDLEKSKCGMFNGGKKIYFFIRLNKGLTIGSDQADVYLYALSSHDGSQRLVYGISTRMHSCSNMFGILMSSKDNNYVVKHTRKIQEQDSTFMNEMIDRNTNGLVSLFNVMRNNEAPLDFREHFLNIVGEIDGKKRVSTVLKDRRKDLLESIESEMQDKGPTYYGLFNGLTHYLTHKHREYTNWSPEYEMLVGNSNDFVKKGLSQIVRNMQSNNISLN